MKATKTTKTDIVLTEKDVVDIIKGYLQARHLAVDSIIPQIETVYDDIMGDRGTEEFRGYRIVANIKTEELWAE